MIPEIDSESLREIFIYRDVILGEIFGPADNRILEDIGCDIEFPRELTRRIWCMEMFCE